MTPIDKVSATGSQASAPKSGLEALIRSVQTDKMSKRTVSSQEADTVVVTPAKNNNASTAATFLKDITVSQSVLQASQSSLDAIAEEVDSGSANEIIENAKKALEFLSSQGITGPKVNLKDIQSLAQKETSNSLQAAQKTASITQAIATSEPEEVESSKSEIGSAIASLSAQIDEEQNSLTSLAQTVRVSASRQGEEKSAQEVNEALSQAQSQEQEQVVLAQSNVDAAKVKKLLSDFIPSGLPEVEKVLTELQKLAEASDPITGLPIPDLPKKLQDIILELNPLAKLPPGLKVMIERLEASRIEKKDAAQ